MSQLQSEYNRREEILLTKELIEQVNCKEFPVLYSVLNLHFSAILNKDITEFWNYQLKASASVMTAMQKQMLICKN